MFRFLVRCVIFCALLTIVLCGIALLPPAPRYSSFLMALIDKHVRANLITSPKIVLVGGSSLAFGMDSAVLQRDLNLPVVNTGLNADLGLKFMLLDVRDSLAPGDLMIVSPEYELFFAPTGGGAALATVLIDVDPRGWKHLSGWERVAMLRHVIPGVSRKALYWFETLGNLCLGRHIEETGLSVYNRHAFNELGDVVIHWEQTCGNVTPSPVQPARQADPRLIEFLRQYIDEMSAVGIRCVLVPPVLQATSFDHQALDIEKLTAHLNHAGIEFIVPPQRYRMDNSLFFDTPYHLCKKGIDIRMQRLKQDLALFRFEP